MTLKVQILQSFRRLLIILVGLMLTWFSEKRLISNTCVHDLLPTWSKNLGRSLNVYLLVAGSRSIDFDFLLSYFFLYGASLVSMHSIKSKMLFGLDYRQTKVTDSTLQNTLAILKNKRIPLDPRATSSDTLALLTNFITTNGRQQSPFLEVTHETIFMEHNTEIEIWAD